MTHKVTVATQERLDYSRYPTGRPNVNPECKSINWNDSSDRKWLASHLHWAMNNGKEVRLIAPELPR